MAAGEAKEYGLIDEVLVHEDGSRKERARSRLQVTHLAVTSSSARITQEQADRQSDGRTTRGNLSLLLLREDRRRR